MERQSLLMGAALAGLMIGTNISYADQHEGKKDSKSATTKVAKEAKGECWGVNECKGTGDCGGKGAGECKGSNECKGKGWVKMTEKDCSAKGGTFQKS